MRSLIDKKWRMTIKQIIIVILTLFVVLLDTHTSSSKREELHIPYDSKLDPVSHRISNALSSSEATKKADYKINRFLNGGSIKNIRRFQCFPTQMYPFQFIFNEFIYLFWNSN